MKVVEYNLVQYAKSVFAKVVVLVSPRVYDYPKRQISNIAANTKAFGQGEGGLPLPTCGRIFLYQSIDLDFEMGSVL